MSRLFDNASSDRLTVASTPITSTPLTMSGWFYTDEFVNGLYYAIMSLANNGATTSYHSLVARVSSGGQGELWALTRAGGTNQDVVLGFAANQWQHAGGVWASDTSREVFLDGVGSGTPDTTERIPSGINAVDVGRVGDSSPTHYFSGYIAECGLWNVALTDVEMAILALGCSPLFIRPQSLVAYWPLTREINDKVGGYTLTATGTTVEPVQPRIFYPVPPFLSYPVSAAGGDINVTVPVASIQITTYAPTVEITAHIDVTVPFASIAITTYAPTAEFPIDVEVPPASIAITTYAPTAAFTEHIDVEVPPASIAITTYAPTVEITEHIDVEVPVASIAITTYVPDVDITTGLDVEVPPASIAITTYAPTVAFSGNIDVEVPPASIAITTYAPTAAFTENIDVEVPPASIGISTYVPGATFTEHINVTVPAASIVISTFAPDVTISDHIDVEVPVASIVITTFAPDATFAGDIDVEVPAATIAITTYAPYVSITSDPGALEYRFRRSYRSPGLVSEVPGTGSVIVEWHVVGDSGEPAFENSWVNYGGAEQVARFTKDDAGVVHVQGLVKSGTIGNVPIFTLPSDYRPDAPLKFATVSNWLFGSVEVTHTTGRVQAQVGSNTWFSINCSFYVGW